VLALFRYDGLLLAFIQNARYPLTMTDSRQISYLTVSFVLVLLAGCTVSAAPLITSTVDTSSLDGSYRLLPQASFSGLREAIANA
jgi:hypothetical protein